MKAPLRYRLEYGAVSVIRGMMRVMPRAAARGVGTGLGRLFYRVDKSHRRIAIEQLRAAFPLRSEAECRGIARAAFEHFGRVLVGLLKISTLSPEGIRRYVEFEGADRVTSALAQGKGVLMFSGHFGSWELHALAHPLAVAPMSVLARPLDNPRLQELLERLRSSTGNKVIYRRGAVRRVLRALEANEVVATMIDQHMVSADAVTVNFFNRPAATSSTVAALALRTGAPLIPWFSLPLPDGRFKLVYEHPVELPAKDSVDPVLELTQRCTDVVEMYVRRHPELWLWMHRRWRVDEGGATTAEELDE